MHMINKLHIIWDLDGTLIDSEQEVLEALIKSVRAVGLMEENQKSPFRVGPTVDKILEASFDSSVLTEMKKMEIIKNFRTNYDNCGFNHTPPFDGIEQILKDLNYDVKLYNLITAGKTNIKKLYKTILKIEPKLNIFISYFQCSFNN